MSRIARALSGPALLLGLVVPASADPPRPNILLLVAEDMSARVGAFGDSVAVTPNLDALAAQGVRYPNTFTTAGVCAPSRAALMTGVHQNTLGAGHMRSHNWSQAKYMAVPPPWVKAFPERLRGDGYFTYVTSKLDYQFSGVLPGQGPWSIWDAESRTRAGVGWSDRPEGVPFFGMYSYMETHESGIFPRWVWPRSLAHLAMAVMHVIHHWGSEDVVSPEQVSVPPYYPDTPTVRKDIARHYNNIHTMDREVGDLLARLEADGLADDTIVIWTTDHGDGLPRAKRELFDSGTRVPMIIRWPEKYRPEHVRPGSQDQRLISFVDLAPLILQMAGVPVPPAMHGRSPLDPGSPRREYVFSARDRVDDADDRQRAVRDARYRYIRNHHPGTPGATESEFRDHLEIMRELRELFEQRKLDAVQRIWFEPRPVDELYDTWEDPHEIRNLATDPGHGAELRRLQAALDAWQTRVPDLAAMPEAELAEQSWPGGEQPVTEAPVLVRDDEGRVVASSRTPGASIELRADGGAWRLYGGPVQEPPGARIEARAVRYGWAGSATSSLGAPGSPDR